MINAKINGFGAKRWFRGRRVRAAMGHRRSAQVIGEGEEGFFDAVVFGVAMVRVKVLVADPGGSVGGLKEAVERVGRPVAARAIGLDMLP